MIRDHGPYERVTEPVAALRKLAGLPHSFLLQAHGPARVRWSIFGADPFAVFRGGDTGEAIALWRDMQGRGCSEVSRGPEIRGWSPFTGGAVGYWAYDYGRRLERLPEMAAADLALPDFVLGFYDVVFVFDHFTGELGIHSSGLPERGDARVRRAAERARQFRNVLSVGKTAVARIASSAEDRRSREARSTFGADGYRAAVERVREHIRRGDIFQANLSQRWTLDLEPADPGPRALELFESLAARSPAPFSAWFDGGDHAVASASPEGFLKLRGRHVETRPIKGTRPRGDQPAADARLAAELEASAKDRAENVMIVDVLRNDLGRVCESGSVQVPELCALESFAQVHHLTSTVTGRLREGFDAFDLLHACFPGGSITGAPKIRAMEILEALEPVRRHVYSGAIGWMDWEGNADWNIAIRTALVTRDAVHFSAGGGITADSDPAAEYLESLDKAEGLRLALSDCFGEVDLGGLARADAG